MQTLASPAAAFSTREKTSRIAFDRPTSPWKVGPGRVTSTTAWRYWNWNPSNDRDFIGLPITTISAAPSEQRQWTQEVRYAGNLTDQLTVHASQR